MERNRKHKDKPAMPGFFKNRDRASKQRPDAVMDAADAAYAKRVLDDPDTEWVDWNDVKRELADQGDQALSQRERGVR